MQRTDFVCHIHGGAKTLYLVNDICQMLDDVNEIEWRKGFKVNAELTASFAQHFLLGHYFLRTRKGEQLVRVAVWSSKINWIRLRSSLTKFSRIELIIQS